MEQSNGVSPVIKVEESYIESNGIGFFNSSDETVTGGSMRIPMAHILILIKYFGQLQELLMVLAIIHIQVVLQRLMTVGTLIKRIVRFTGKQ